MQSGLDCAMWRFERAGDSFAAQASLRTQRGAATRNCAPRPPMTPYLAIENLSVAYGGTTVLDRVSLGVERGEMIALLGSSGCGKTSLLRAIAGFVQPSGGTIRVDGVDIHQHSLRIS